MKRNITIEIDCGDIRCESCRHANNPESYRFCAVFDERIRAHPNAHRTGTAFGWARMRSSNTAQKR